MHVIEYQWRGLPHFHMAVRMEKVNTDSVEESIEFTDKFISAELPIRENFPDMTDEAFTKYKHLVEKHMVHTCANAINGCKSKPDDICRRGYDRTETIPTTYINEKGFLVYRRRTEDDLKIVPHSPECLLDWDAHLNVEFSGTVNHILYMFKYLYKGTKKEGFNIETRDHEGENEVSLFLKGHILCSMDAVNRILGFHTYPKSSPAVKTIKVKLPSEYMHLSASEKLSCDLLVYFSRPPQLYAFKYTEFFKKYIVYNVLPVRYKNHPELLNKEYYELRLPHSTTVRYICQRKNPDNVIVRMTMNYINQGEIFYFRLMLLKRALINDIDAKTDQHGVTHRTFQQAALARGYIKDVEDTKEIYTEFAAISTPWEMRQQFALMMSIGHPMMSIIEIDEFRTQLIQDYLDDGMAVPIATNRMLQDLEALLTKEGLSLDDFGFPLPEGMETELEIAKLKYNDKEQEKLLKQLNEANPNNQEQQQIFDELTSSIDKFLAEGGKENVFNFISGPGGTGKTDLFKKLQAWCRAEGILINCCAATTLAALLFDGATTAHSLFKYPVVEDQDIDAECLPECKLDEKSERLELLMETQVIFWDEFVSNDRVLFEAVINCLSLKYNKKFIFICAGDFRQILPVVKFGTKAEVIAATISSSPYWSLFNKFFLFRNMRLSGMEATATTSSNSQDYEIFMKQLAYAKFLENLSENKESEHLHILEKVDNDHYKVGLPLLNYFTTKQEEDAIKWIYPNGEFDPNIALNSVILASKNDSVDKWNNKIQGMNTNTSKKYDSRDSFDEVDDEKGILANILGDEVKNRFNRNGIPPHSLSFKVDDVCIVLRAIPQLSLATNTRVQIVRLLRNGVRVKTLNEPTQRFVNLQRINFKFRLEYGESYQMTRIQLPLRLAYAMTYNKSQSQTLNKVLVDCTEEPFAHGHAYVSFSRVRNNDNISAYINEEQLHPIGDSSERMIPVISNIVYKDILI